MTALAQARVQNSTVGVSPRSGRCNIEEHYPGTCKKNDRSRFEEKIKMMGNLFEEISEADEDAAGSSDSSTSSLNLDGRSPYALPVEDRSWYFTPRCQNSFVAHPLVSPKFARRTTNCRATLQRGFSEPVFRRKRSPFSPSERRSGGSFEQLTIGPLNLPPIPEAGSVQIFGEKSSRFEEDETDYDDSSECSDFNGSS